jgi:hypothetical protein
MTDIIKITSNKSKRHYTIYTTCSKWRTVQMSKKEFEHARLWTFGDWRQFLKTDKYYAVK